MKKTLLLLLIIFVKISSADSQVLDSMMKVYAEEFPEQKVHVHFDKEIYRAGESIWFKAYILAGFRLTSNSKNFYTELIDKQGNIVQRKVYPIVESTASGNFDLAENTPAGSYICRAYTSWMLNFDTAFLYTKQLTVVDKN
ncbi:MAG TPA: MG2 domain-containing protein, partial [Segetibacter sp.]